MRVAALLLCLVAGSEAGEEWLVRGGNDARNRPGEELGKLDPKPIWRRALRERDARWVFDYGTWYRVMQPRARAPRPKRAVAQTCLAYPAVSPAYADGHVWVRDGLELVLWSGGAGRFRPLRDRYLLADTNASELPCSVARPKRGEDFFRYLGHGWGASSIGRSVFVQVEEGDRLFAYDRGCGLTLWGWHEDLASTLVRQGAGYDAWLRDYRAHAGTRFLGPGLLIGDRLYTVAFVSKPEEVSVWALEAKTGVVLSRTPLPDAVAPRPGQPMGAGLAYDRGRLFVVTPGPCFFALDVEAPAKPKLRQKLEPGTGFAFGDPVVAGEHVVVAAADGRDVVCFHRATGVLWVYTPPKNSGLEYVVGVQQGTVVVAGRSVAGLDLVTGAVKWGPVPVRAGTRYGRGYLSATTAYLPTRQKACVERFRIATGERLPPLAFAVPKLGHLLAIDGRLFTANEDEVMCFSTIERELERATNMVDRGLLLVRAGRVRNAADAFAKAVQEADAIRYLLELALKTRDRTLVDRARKIATVDPYKAQVELVDVRLGGDATELKTTYKDTPVHLGGKVMPAAKAARMLGK